MPQKKNKNLQKPYNINCFYYFDCHDPSTDFKKLMDGYGAIID